MGRFEEPVNTALQSLELSHASARVVVLPQLGGKIARLSLGGRQWLWSNARLPFCLPEPGSSYIETADSGGFDECFPTVGPCTLPTGEHLPDHGELWSQCCDVVDVSERGMMCIWQTSVVGARLSRKLWIDDDGALELHYRLEHRFGAAFPFVWSAHPCCR